MSTIPILRFGERASSVLDLGGLIHGLHFTCVNGYERLHDLANHPWADRSRILETQEAVATLVDSWQTSYTTFQGVMQRAAQAMKDMHTAQSHFTSKTLSVEAAEKFLDASREAALILGGLIGQRKGGAGSLQEIATTLSLTQSPTLTNFLEVAGAEEVSFHFKSVQGRPTAASSAVSANRIRRNWHDPSNTMLAGFLWTHPSFSNFSNEIDHVKQGWAELDCLRSLAQAAVTYELVRPEIVDDIVYEVSGGRHPLLWMWHKNPGRRSWNTPSLPVPVPNTISLGRRPGQKNTMIITGPNSGGKTTLMQQVGLTTVMALMGGFVPAATGSVPQIGVFDAIETLFGSTGELGKGGAHAMEVKAVAETYNRLSPRTLALLDEPFRNTDPDSGKALTHATIVEMGIIAGIVIASTHHIDGLPAVARANPSSVELFQMGHDPNSGNPRPTHVLSRGVTPLRLYGVSEAKRVGLPPAIAQKV